LIYSVEGGHTAVALLLILSGANVNLSSIDQMSALMLAADDDNIHIARSLLEAKASPNGLNEERIKDLKH